MMKKPKYYTSLFAIIFCALGGAFFLMGSIFFIFLFDKPTNDGKTGGSLGLYFIIVGSQILLLGIISLSISIFKNKRRKNIISNGMEIDAIITNINFFWYTRFGSSHPYKVYYKYKWNGNEYFGNSCLIWEEPKLKENDEIKILIHTQKPNQSEYIYIPIDENNVDYLKTEISRLQNKLTQVKNNKNGNTMNEGF